MNKQEAIEQINYMDTLNINDMIAGQQVDMVIKNQVLDIINQIDEPEKLPLSKPLEPEKPVVPQFVAEWIKSKKESFSDASAIDMYASAIDMYAYAIDIYDNLTLDNNGGYYHEVWLWVIDHHYDFIKAWQFAKEVEE